MNKEYQAHAERLRGIAVPIEAFAKIEPCEAEVVTHCDLCGCPVEYVVKLTAPGQETVFVGEDCASALTDDSMAARMVLRLRQKVEWWKRTLTHGGIAKVTPADVERWERR